MVFALRRTPPAPSRHTVELDGRAVPVRLVPHARARRYILRLDKDGRGLRVTVPFDGDAAEALDFVARQHGWIRARLAGLDEPVPFAAGSLVPLRGELHRIAHRPRERGVVWSEAGGNEPLLCVSGAADHIGRRLQDWLRRQAERDLTYSVAVHARALGVEVRRISLRDPASRWGSCSSTGRLSFSWRLVMAPPFVLDYVAAHEVAHLKEMNHGPRFWRITAELCADTEPARAWLKTHGAGLHRYGG